MNKPPDMGGLGMCINAKPDVVDGREINYQDKHCWSLDKKCKTVDPRTVKQFQTHVDRVKDSMLNLPPIEQEYRDFKTQLKPEEAVAYNALVASARSLRLRLEGNGAKAQDLQKLMAMLLKMQQMLVAPRMAATGAEHFKQNPELFDEAAREETGALAALRSTIDEVLNGQPEEDGRSRTVIVACEQPTLMEVGKRYMQLRDCDFGDQYFYDGTLSQKQRSKTKHGFLHCRKGVLWLSIRAGGTGLHLVAPDPFGCRNIIFWGARSFSPQQVWQTLKRCHRIGQKHLVRAVHLIARGSVDYAINQLHEDKSRLGDMVTGDGGGGIEEDGEWKRSGRIVDSCELMMDDGNFDAEAAAAEKAEKKPLLAPRRAPSAPQPVLGRRLPANPPPLVQGQPFQRSRPQQVPIRAPQGASALVGDFPLPMSRPSMRADAPPSAEQLLDMAGRMIAAGEGGRGGRPPALPALGD